MNKLLEFIEDPKNIMAILKHKGYKFFSRDDKNYNLNIIGWRSQDMRSLVYNDFFTATWVFQGKVYHEVFQGTTDPGLFFLENPMNIDGTAILKPGQYLGVYKLCGAGYNHGCKGHGRKNRKCLRQVKPMYFYRDNNKDGRPDLIEENVVFEIIGANTHDPILPKQVGDPVHKDSGGCQVPITEDYEYLIGHENSLCERALQFWPNSFSYTLLTEDEVNEYLKKDEEPKKRKPGRPKKKVAKPKAKKTAKAKK